MTLSKRSTWADVRKGDVVELAGNEWRVARIVFGKKSAKVVVARKGREAKSTVALKDRVRIIPPKTKVMDRDGVQRRWATERELETALKPGNAKVRKPPEKPKGAAWDVPVTGAEKRLGKMLGARLVGEATDEAVGYYVPPVDVTTVASHLALMHGGIPAAADDEGAMIRIHDAQHAEAKSRGARLAVNHWHTETRP